MASKKVKDEKMANLIALVQTNKMLWDYSDNDYKNNELKRIKWASIGKQLDLDGFILIIKILKIHKN